jgi:hypothetical protein
MDHQIFIDRLLETENLTDDLEDPEADHLLNWGVSQLDTLLAGIEDEEAAHDKVHHLMKFMRGINYIVANLPVVSPGALAELHAHYAQAFNRIDVPDSDEFNAIASTVSSLKGIEAVRFLLDWVQNR